MCKKLRSRNLTKQKIYRPKTNGSKEVTYVIRHSHGVYLDPFIPVR